MVGKTKSCLHVYKQQRGCAKTVVRSDTPSFYKGVLYRFLITLRLHRRTPTYRTKLHERSLRQRL